MRRSTRQDLPTLFLAALWAFPSFAFAPTCFDFKQGKAFPLKPDSPLKGEKVQTAYGVRSSDGTAWGSTRGYVTPPVAKVYEWLLDHKNWKDMSRTKMAVEPIQLPGFLEAHKVDVNVNVWAFIHLPWTEEWAYKLIKGTKKAPEEILIDYQKVAGTDRIKRLCGSIVLTKKGSGTQITFYEEANAEHYEAPAILEMHGHFLEKINKLPSK